MKQVPTITEEQKQLLQQTTLTEGENAWEHVLQENEDDQYWVAMGILSCIEHGYGLTKLEINWQARNLRRELA